MGRLFWGLIIVLLTASAQGEEPPFIVDFRIGWDGCYRPMEWTPVEINVSKQLKEPFGGVLTLTAQQDGLTKMSVTHPFVLTPDLPLHVPLVTKIAFAASDCQLVISDDRGRTRWTSEYPLWDFSGSSRNIQAVRDNDVLVGLVGVRAFGLRRLGQRSRTQDTYGEVYVKGKQIRQCPWDWTGYAPLDALVLYNVDWDRFSRHQLKAVAEWVANGGRAVIVLGSYPLGPTNPLAELLPVKPGPARQVKVPAHVRGRWGCGETETDTVTCWPLETAGATGWSVKTLGLGQSACATGPVGFGKVTVLAFDPSVLGGRQAENVAPFWRDLLNPVLGGKGIELGTREQEPGYHSETYYELGQGAQGTNGVLSYLMNIPELRPLSLWWVIGLLVLLALLLGPVDYFLLKRLDRLPLTWITAAVWIVLFSVGAFYGVQAIRGGKMYVRVVSVTDGITGADCNFSTVYSGIFAPASDDYQLTGLQGHQWWSSVAPTEGGNLWAYNMQTATRRITCLQQDGGNLPSSLPINIWSMQCMLTESRVPDLPIRATVARRPGRQVEVTVHNRSDTPIAQGEVRFADDLAMTLGAVPAGGKQTFRGRLRSGAPWDVNPHGMVWDAYGRDTMDSSTVYIAQGALRRTRAIRSYLADGAAVVCVRYEQSPPPCRVADRNNELHHVRLVRLVVFPE